MKVIVQIPCLNEEKTLAKTVSDIPREIPGVDEVRVLIVNDGSNDNTVEVAKECGVDYIVSHKTNRGLARSFRTGVDACLRLGADIIVNTDGDNQYAGWDIPKLIRPITDGKADIVVGDRQTKNIEHFSTLKKVLQKFGSAVVRTLSETEVPDAVSGFRAISRSAALQLNIVSPFSYTVEMVIQAGKKHIAVASVPIETNPKTRDSRLFKSVPNFIKNQLATIVRMYSMYQPLRVFVYLGLALTIIGAIPFLRFLWFYITGEDTTGHIQSLIFGSIVITMGAFSFMIGLIADLISFNRQLIEMALERIRTIEIKEEEKSHEENRCNNLGGNTFIENIQQH